MSLAIDILPLRILVLLRGMLKMARSLLTTTMLVQLWKLQQFLVMSYIMFTILSIMERKILARSSM
ncbi:hypothetical protein GW15_0222000 [Xanthomonas axonopodis pv. vasculorum]|uniref:Uncharacterized protein n=1 Tax=Xanthomonas axonopodis pv. vasculorum TaxID=325777 RepID=A0A098PUJ2_9XANT|nr:hypothetical protein GW15_0222000 [Xanthomonas axonopodis pv. vasculorum]